MKRYEIFKELYVTYLGICKMLHKLSVYKAQVHVLTFDPRYTQ